LVTTDRLDRRNRAVWGASRRADTVKGEITESWRATTLHDPSRSATITGSWIATTIQLPNHLNDSTIPCSSF
jgi:hypothetical protein